METKDYLRYLSEVIHTTIIATVDDDGRPVTAAIDMMDWDEDGLYFLTAKGKSFYDRLIKREFAALTGLKGENTMTSVAVSIRGKVREIGPEKLPDLFAKNRYMNEIYPNPESRKALTVFYIYQGSGEWFDLSKRPIERASFSFGGATTTEKRYYINSSCVGCGLCAAVCPQDCIRKDCIPFVIEQNHCLHCGNCLTVCQMNAVEIRM